MTIATIEWKRTADELPDDDTTVLISECDGEVWIGWLDAEQWRDALGMPIATPIWWSEMPEAPK